MNCLNGLVGISDTDCTCTIGSLDAETRAKLALSRSGLYTDGLPGAISLKMMKEFGDNCTNYAQMALDAMKNAQVRVRGDLVVALSNGYDQAYRAFVGTIGRMTISGTLPVTQPLQGVILQSRGIIDGLIKLRTVKLAVNGTGAVNIRIAKQFVGTNAPVMVATYQIAAQMNTWAVISLMDDQHPEGLVLPLYEDGNAVEYLVYWDRSSNGFSPKDNDVQCMTCKNSANADLNNYIHVQGFEADAGNWSGLKRDMNGHGLALDADIRCSPDISLCNALEHQNEIAVLIANALWYRAGELIAEAVLNSNEINRYTMQGDKYILGKRSHFRLQSELCIIEIAKKIDLTRTGCYTCSGEQPVYGIIRG